MQRIGYSGWLLVVVLVGLAEGCGGSTTPRAAGPTPAFGTAAATIAVHREAKLATIGPDFAGFSYSKARLNTGLFRPSNTALIDLFERLGPSLLRIGANGVDQTRWNASGPGNTEGEVAPADVDALAGFLRATHWKVLYAVNMADDRPAAAAAEARYAVQALGDRLYGFEIGNEPDLYAKHGLRPRGWGYRDFLREWRKFHRSIHAAAPNAVFAGPASAGATYVPRFARDAGKDIALLTEHYYRGDGRSPLSTLDELLHPHPGLVAKLRSLATLAAANGIRDGSRLAEANSFHHGGALGVSNAYGTALWAIDFLFTSASYGSSGVNLQGGGDRRGYTPIADKDGQVVEVRPVYYGMLTFTLAGQGDMLSTTVRVSGANFSAYTISPTPGSTNLVLVNKEPSVTVHASVDLGEPISHVTLTRLAGKSLDSTQGFTIGGAPVEADGSWSPQPAPTEPVVGSTLEVDVPPASAVVVQAMQ